MRAPFGDIASQMAMCELVTDPFEDSIVTKASQSSNKITLMVDLSKTVVPYHHMMNWMKPEDTVAKAILYGGVDMFRECRDSNRSNNHFAIPIKVKFRQRKNLLKSWPSVLARAS